MGNLTGHVVHSDLYSEAVKYVNDLGWYLVPIPAGTKGPTRPGWNLKENAISTVSGCDLWKNNTSWGMGVLLDQSGIVAIDVDHLEDTKLLFDALGFDYDELFKGAPRIIGRPGRDKAIFKAPPGVELNRKALTWPHKDDLTRSNPKKFPPTTVIELRGGALQDVLPPSIHPDTQAPYRWGNSPFGVIPELPAQLLALWLDWGTLKPQLESACPWSIKVEPPAPTMKTRTAAHGSTVIDQFNDAHDVEVMLVKYGYTRTKGGRYLSPFSSSKIAGVHLFKDQNRGYSHHASDDYSGKGFDPFELFCRFEHSDNIKEAVKTAAKLLGLNDHVEIDPDTVAEGKKLADAMFSKKPAKEEAHTETMLTIPGVLQKFVDYYNATAIKPQPRFAIQAALAFGSVVMGRRWITDRRNYSSLYFINVGKSSCGKEHSKTVIEEMLEASELTDLIGPAGYSSGTGVYSALVQQPTHLTVIDELGRVLGSAKNAGNTNKQDSHTMLMEVFGRVAGRITPQAFSMASKTSGQREQFLKANPPIRRPALTLLAMTTPSTLYESLSKQYVTDGFLPRFIIVESDRGREKSRKPEPASAPLDVIEWAQWCQKADARQGNLATVKTGPEVPPDPVILPFDDTCDPILDAFEERMLTKQGQNEGLAEMFGRAKEMGQRVALIIANSCRSTSIMPVHLTWAFDYVGYHVEHAAKMFDENLNENEIEEIMKMLLKIVTKAKEKGVTERDIGRGCALFNNSLPMRRDQILELLKRDHGITKVDTRKNKSGSRMAFILPQYRELYVDNNLSIVRLTS